MFPNKTAILSGGALEEPFSSSYSMDFDGSNEYLDIGTGLGIALGDTYTGSLSVSLWFKCDVTSSEDSGIISIGTTLISDNGIFTVRIQDDKLLYLLAGGQWRRRGAFTDTASWHHLVCIYDTTDTSGAGGGANSKMYLDGSEFGSLLGHPTNDFPVDSDMAFNGKKTVIGTYFTANYPFDGKIDDVGIWDVALDTDAVTAIYNSGTPIDLNTDSGSYDNSGDLVGYWKMGDGATFSTNWTIPDDSTNSNDGTSQNMEEADVQTDTP